VSALALDLPRPRRTKLLLSPPVLRVLSGAVLAIVWEIAGRKFPESASYPSAIFAAAYDSFASEVAPAFRDTLASFALGFGVSILAGTLIGLLMARSRLVDLVLNPYVYALYATPRLALIPVMIIWLGVDFNLRVGVVIVSGIFPVIVNTYLGAKEVDRDLLDVGDAFAATSFQKLRSIVIPAALPFIYAGVRIGMGRALIGTIVAEIEAATAGVGKLMKDSANALDMAGLLVPIILLGLLSIALTRIIRELELRSVMPWLRKRSTPLVEQGA